MNNIHRSVFFEPVGIQMTVVQFVFFNCYITGVLDSLNEVFVVNLCTSLRAMVTS